MIKRYGLNGMNQDGIGEIQTVLDTHKQGIDKLLSQILNEAEYVAT